MASMPVIAIVGRPNVGKSSLLNALVGKRISIVQDMPGVTRDRISYPLLVEGRYVELVDTGGYGFDDPDLSEQIKYQIEVAMSRANMVLFVVDCQDGLTPPDREIADLLRKRELKTALVANKADSEKADVALAEFARLGFGTPIGVSALRERNLDLVIAAIRKSIDFRSAPREIPEPQMLVAIVGKRNSGKSTLVNAIARLYEGDTDRVIVSEVPGTTRDSVDVRFEKDGKTLVVIDTAGVRKRRHMVTNDIEFYSFHRAQRSIRRADIVLMLMDGTEPASEPDKKLAQYISEQHKPVIIVINKWDKARATVRAIRQDLKTEADRELTDTQIMEEYRKYIADEMPYLAFAPVEFITAKDGRNVQHVLDTAQHLLRQASERLGTGRLNRAIRQILDERQPSTPSGRRPKIYYATQTDTAPPTIVLFVNNPQYIDEPYKRFMINRMRELLPYSQVPIRLVLRGRQKGEGPVRGQDEIEMADGEAGSDGNRTRPL